MGGTTREQKDEHADAPPQQLGEALQWETPRPKRQSFLGRLAAGSGTTTTTTTMMPKPAAGTAEKHDYAPAMVARKPVPAAPPAAAAAAAATAAFTKSPAEHAPPPDTATALAHAPAGVTAKAGPSSQPRGFKSSLDAILPPHRTYLGGRLTRRSLIIFVILPLLVLFLLILPLAIGLGVGLSKKNSSSDVPLPPDLGNGGSGDGSTNSGKTYTGELTYYSTGLGACGMVSGSDDAIVSVSHILFDAASTSGNPNANPLCGRKIRITRDRGGRSADKRNGRRRGTRSDGDGGAKLERRSEVEVTVVDRCEGCKAADLDLSLGAFTQLADESEGRVEASWTWV